MVTFTWVGLTASLIGVSVLTLAFEHRHDKRFFD